MSTFYALHSIWTVVLFVAFVGIIFWAWSGKRKKSFNDAAQMPLEDEEHDGTTKKSGENHHG